jgi:anti-sigma28 factor (negative regulator of flagellin synthesis)
MRVPDIKGMFSIARGVLDPKKGQPAARTDAPAGADKVELSSQGQAVQKLAAERADTKARAAFVAELQAQFKTGELKADSEKTAAAMVGSGLFDDLITGR